MISGPWQATKRSIPGGNAGNRITLAEMHQMAVEGSEDFIVIQQAQEIVRFVPERDDRATISAVLDWVRSVMRYTHDPLGAELVKKPRHIVEQVRLHGVEPMDCDDVSLLAAALLGALGYRVEFVTVATDPSRRGEWTHVYLRVQTKHGWIAIDPIMREWGLGQEPPTKDLTAPRAYHPGVGGLGMLGNVSQQNLIDFSSADAALKSVGGFAQQYFATKQKDADAKIAAAQARAATLAARMQRREKEGFFTDASGEVKWGNVALVGGGAALAIYLFTRKGK